jgi:hypothetical protein
VAKPPLRPATIVGAGAALLCVTALAIWWPGVAAYDSVEQYKQVLSGVYDDWHPPAMARLWAALHPLGPGAAPMFVLQVMLNWLGFGLLGARLARSGRPRTGFAVLAIGAFPVFAGWQAVVLKDTQMLGALLAAVGLFAWWRLDGRRVPVAAIAAITLLLGYAMLVRANAVFAIVPLAVMLCPAPTPPWLRAGAFGIATLALLVAMPIVNHRMLGAGETTITRTIPTFDLAGIAHFSGADDALPPVDRALIAARHCYQPFFWDPLGDDAHCGAVAARLNALPGAELNRLWLVAVARHPLAYAAHRLNHLNATERLVVPLGWESAIPPSHSEPNDLGLGSPGAAARRASLAAGWLVETPLSWPILWIVIAVTGLWIAVRRPPGPLRNLALALAVSALSLEASFAVVSIASDLRYHLWPMTATALMAILLLAEGSPLPRRATLVGGAALALVIGIGATARISLLHAPDGYEAMLG